MSFDESELTFQENLNDSQWTDIESNEDAHSHRSYEYYSDYDNNTNDMDDDDDDDDDEMHNSDEDDTYSLAESIEIPDNDDNQTEFDDVELRSLLFNVLQSNESKICDSIIPDFKSYSLLNENNTKCIKLELIDKVFIKITNPTESGLFTLIAHVGRKSTCNACKRLTYFITDRNKNQFIINGTHTALLYAVHINSFELVSDLINNFNCDPNLTHSCQLSSEQRTHTKFIDKNKNTCFLKYFNKDELRREKQAIVKTDESSIEIHYFSTLMLAVRNNNLKLVEFLLNRGADVNFLFAKDKKSCGYPSISALSLAIETNNLDLIRLLVSYGANINERLWLAKTSHSHMLTFLLTLVKLNDPEHPDSDTLTQLYDYLIKSDVNLTYGDLYLLCNELLKFTTIYFPNLKFSSVYALIKMLCIFKLDHLISTEDVLLIQILIKLYLFLFEKNDPKQTMDYYKKLNKLIHSSALVAMDMDLIVTYIFEFHENNMPTWHIVENLSDSKLLNGDNGKINKPRMLSLKQICRLRIKSLFRYYTMPEIMKLNLPSCLKRYLYFSDA